MKGGIMFKFYFARVLAHLAALMVVPVLWWYAPKSLLVVIKFNTMVMNEVVHAGVRLIPDPTVQHIAKRVLQVGDTMARMLRAGLSLVPVEYRDQVEVLARVRYEPGGWMMIGELGLIFFGIWLWLRWRRENRIRKEIIRNLEPLLEPHPLRLPRADWPVKE